jgi:transcriptional regulator with XRE-family HTH domain
MDKNQPDRGSKAEELRIRDEHRRNPVREVPADTILGADVGQLFKLVGVIRREREAQGLTPEQVADRARIDAEVYTRFEAGHSFNLTVSTLTRIARAVGKKLVVSLDDADLNPTTTPPEPEDEQEQAAVLRYSMSQAAKVAKEDPF